MNAPAARREHADAPVAELVAHPLDENRARVRNLARGRDLIAQVLEQIFGRARVEVVLADEPVDGGRGGQTQQIAHEPADREPELQRTARAVALPERHLAGLARRG